MRPPFRADRRRDFLQRFRRDRQGVAAVEFALVSAPFLAVIFAIIETALVLFADQVLENGVSQAARLVRTGQVQELGVDQAAFRQQVCSKLTGLFNCESSLKLDVRTVSRFSEVDLSDPIDESGNLVENFIFDPGQSGSIVVVRAFYEWPTFVPQFANGTANLANGKRLIAAAATFRNEQF